MDVEKAKKDMVYFSENVLGFKLMEWQKEILRKYENGEIIFWGNYRYGKNMVMKTIREHRLFKEK